MNKFFKNIDIGGEKLHSEPKNILWKQKKLHCTIVFVTAQLLRYIH